MRRRVAALDALVVAAAEQLARGVEQRAPDRDAALLEAGSRLGEGHFEHLLVRHRPNRFRLVTGSTSIVLPTMRERGPPTTVHVLGCRTRIFTPAFAAPARTDR